MAENLLAVFREHQVEDTELLSLIEHRYGPGGMDAEGSVVYPSSEDYALKILTDDVEIQSIEPGPRLTTAGADELVSAVRSILVESTGTLVATDVLFSNPRPVTGMARFGDALQLVPAPDAAPRPKIAQADHPFIIEFQLKQSIDNGVTNMRRTRGTVEWAWILNLLLRTKIRFINFRARSMWAIEDAPGAAAGFASAKWCHEGYGIPGMTGAQAAFSEAGPCHIPVVPHEQYYSAGWHPVDDTFRVPDSLPRLINAVWTLPRIDRRRFMRAAQWFYAVLELFDDNTSSSFQALASAIEAMIPPTLVDPCPQCGKDRSPGPTARFNRFLERFAPLPAGVRRPRFFGTRSGLTHGSLLFFLDEVPWAYFSSTESLRQRMRHGEFFHTARTALVNWLLTYGPSAH